MLSITCVHTRSRIVSLEVLSHIGLRWKFWECHVCIRESFECATCEYRKLILCHVCIHWKLCYVCIFWKVDCVAWVYTLEAASVLRVYTKDGTSVSCVCPLRVCQHPLIAYHERTSYWHVQLTWAIVLEHAGQSHNHRNNFSLVLMRKYISLGYIREEE